MNPHCSEWLFLFKIGHNLRLFLWPLLGFWFWIRHFPLMCFIISNKSRKSCSKANGWMNVLWNCTPLMMFCLRIHHCLSERIKNIYKLQLSFIRSGKKEKYCSDESLEIFLCQNEPNQTDLMWCRLILFYCQRSTYSNGTYSMKNTARQFLAWFLHLLPFTSWYIQSAFIENPQLHDA